MDKYLPKEKPIIQHYEVKTLYKVLNKDLCSPFEKFKYEQNKVYHCNDFDDSDKDCSRGFYATDIDGLPYAYNIHKKVFMCEVWGKEKEIDKFKRRYEYIKILNEVPKKELISKAKAIEDKVGYRLSEVINPINPLRIKVKPTDKDIELLKQWVLVRRSVGDLDRHLVGDSVESSVRDSVGDSVWCSVRDSVGDSVGYSVWYLVRYSVMDSVMDSVGDSVWCSVYAYIGSLFLNIKKWEYIKHKDGEYPFQLAVDLWKRGLVPSYDGNTWRLHIGKKADIVWEGRL